MTTQNLNELFQPRMVDRYMLHTPHPVQQIAMSLNNKELLFGGAAGGGKSDWALMSALQYVDVPGYSALILRRAWTDLQGSGAILNRFDEWMAPYRKTKEVHRKDEGRMWVFPSGATIQFGYADRDQDKYKFQGGDWQLICLDEATQFEPSVYEYLRSRLRRPQIQCILCDTALTRYTTSKGNVAYRHSNRAVEKICSDAVPDQAVLDQYPPAADGLSIFEVPLRLRLTANPGGKSHLYFKERFIDPETRIKDAVFIPSALKDNPSLDAEDYKKTLEGMSLVDRERLLNGNWEIMDKGNLFDRGNFQVLFQPLRDAEVKQRVRCWDFAASDGQKSDYTVGALVALTHDNRLVIEDIKRGKWLPQETERIVKETAIEDGIGVRIYSEQEPGSAGKTVVSYYTRHILMGYQYRGIRATGSKTDRAGALVSQAEARNLYMLERPWNKALLDEASTFPTGIHDDQIDALALAVNQLIVPAKRPVRLVF